MAIKKAVITAAGRGTRFLPVSSAYQKEMVALLNKPQLQYVIEEAIESGIEEIAVVNREGVETFARYLDEDDKLWKFLKETGKEALMDSWVEMKNSASIELFEQKESDHYGNGTPFVITKDFTSGDPFAAMWGDEILIQTEKGSKTCIEQMEEYYIKYSPVAVMSVQKTTRKEICKVASYDYVHDSEIPFHARGSIEKPEYGKEPSLYGNASRFILTPEVVEELENDVSGKNGELWLTDATNRLMEKGELVIAPPWEGSIRVGVGDPAGWLKANVHIALQDPKIKEEVTDFLSSLQLG